MPSSESRVEKTPNLIIGGLRGYFTDESWQGIPQQWQRLGPYLGKIRGQVGRVAYGLCFNKPRGVDYVSGVQLSDPNVPLPDGFSLVQIPAQTYLVFPHEGHVSELRQALDEIGRKKLPASGHRIAPPAVGAPDFFERYGEGFNQATGTGDIEVWMPIQT